MGTPFLCELRIFSFNFAPKGWAQCNGQLLPINQNQALFSILGTTYGGDGRVTFGLPNLQGRVPFHTGEGLTLGQRAGEEAHTLINNEMPAHNHFVNAFAAAGSVNPPTGNQFAEPIATIAANNDIPISSYGSAAADRVMDPLSVTTAGGSQPHLNMSPYLTLLICISLQGIFPSRN
jgi:microcystin-dependent protein